MRGTVLDSAVYKGQAIKAIRVSLESKIWVRERRPGNDVWGDA
jgi:hypothetical protein